MRMADTGDLWWKSAVVYCADVQTFNDSDGDGIGDLRGMTERLEYLADLGITCLWLMPFYPTADADDGYDITDFFGVDPRFGTHGDFVELVRAAKSHGLRVVIDFVMNHTSAEHPWFRSARRSKGDAYRNFYVWSPTEPEDSPEDVVFPDRETGIWELEPGTGEYYLHHFYSHQPDLNIAEPRVRDEIARTLGFWLELGVSGFRVDAVPFLFAKDSVPTAAPAGFQPHEYLGDVRNFVTRRVGDALLLGEVNLPYPDQLRFFGGPDGDGLNMQFDFNGMQAIYLSMARGDARPLAAALQQRPALDITSQWANFVRNHDELTLDKLTDSERQEVFAAFGPRAEHQLYDRGLRRRLPAMVGGDDRRLQLAYSLMFSLPGTPVLFYGEEIGMAENLAVPGRLAVRTPMQWTDDPGAGFTSAADRLTRPVPDGLFGPERVNAAAQRRDPGSLWWFIRSLIRRYRQAPQIGWSRPVILDQPQHAVLAHLCREESGWMMLALHNFGSAGCIVPVELADAPEDAVLADLIGARGERGERVELQNGRAELEIEPYGCRWLQVLASGDVVLL